MRRRDWHTYVAPLVAVVGLCMSTAAGAETPDAEALDGETLFNERTCLTCHGKDAKTPILPDYPILAGQNAAYALRQMQDIKSGARSNGNSAAMKGVMFLVNDDEMKILSEYISKLPR
jgi:cytochrome c